MDKKPTTDHLQLSRWNDRYNSSDYLFGTTPNDFLASVARQVPAGKTLCLADGEGRNGVYLATLGHQVTSIDASATGLAKAGQLAAAKGVKLETIEADLNAFELGEQSWDCIVSIFFHMPPEMRKPLHARVVEALKPGGYLILEAYRPEQIKYGTGGPPVAEFMMNLEALSVDFAALEFLHAEEIERDVIEGKGHSGRAAVVQLLARKPLD